jgi:peptide/nickel transport system substrate-binding protein
MAASAPAFRFRLEPTASYVIHTPPGNNGPFLAFNQTHKAPVLREIFSDVRFRRAMSLALDREEINERLFLGLGRPAQSSPINVPFVSDEDRLHMTAHDPAGANRLLDEMGLARGPDGMRLRPASPGATG